MLRGRVYVDLQQVVLVSVKLEVGGFLAPVEYHLLRLAEDMGWAGNGEGRREVGSEWALNHARKIGGKR